MFLLDDLLLAPARGLMSVFRSLHDAAQEELAREAENIRNQLSEMYVLLETGRMSEAEFDRHERDLLERLERIDARDDAGEELAEDEAAEADVEVGYEEDGYEYEADDGDAADDESS